VINHFGAIQLRVTGSGNLKSRLYSLPNSAGVQVTENLADLAMATAYREPVLLANMLQERAQLKVWTEAIDETFHIRSIVIFAKPTYTSDPQ
jgi:hypothetical protein